MPPLFKPKFNKNKDSSDSENNSGYNSSSVILSDHPDYKKLIKHFERAEFKECLPIIEKLEKIYPGNPRINGIKIELKMKLSVRNITTYAQKREILNKLKYALRILVMIIVGILIGTIVTYSFQVISSSDTDSNEDEQDMTSVVLLENQAEQLLLVGNPESAEEIIEKIRAIDKDNERLPELTLRTEMLQQQKEKYQRALSLSDENNQVEALRLLKEIEAEQPGLWDVSQRIIIIERNIKIKNLISEGNTAFQEENWSEAINVYEEVLSLDPSLDDQQLKEQLFRSYLNQIIFMLQEENASIEDINKAAEYYRNAVSLFPQSRQFLDEREDLQELSSNLLELKYTQTARSLLADSFQDSNTIADAVSYLRKAAKIAPNNSALQLELQNAEYYQIAFNDFIEMKWTQAKINLEKIVEVDLNYAGGNAKILLLESYYLLGEQYFSAGFYQDAILNLEQAELLIWEERNENLMRFFSTQILIGNAFGELGDYENAVSYYRYATNAINIYSKLLGNANLTTKYLEANDYFAGENFEAAYVSYKEVIDNIEVVYSTKEIEIEETIVLAFFAHDHESTVESILKANDLQGNMTVKRGLILIVPSLQH